MRETILLMICSGYIVPGKLDDEQEWTTDDDGKIFMTDFYDTWDNHLTQGEHKEDLLREGCCLFFSEGNYGSCAASSTDGLYNWPITEHSLIHTLHFLIGPTASCLSHICVKPVSVSARVRDLRGRNGSGHAGHYR
ncbi:hypothetical protein LZ30DRAFT_411593 [Colletotrichum cereale]|nr:hypothetical protein LZ30DRAFT_411593 [Colletotrichum cereale]